MTDAPPPATSAEGRIVPLERLCADLVRRIHMLESPEPKPRREMTEAEANVVRTNRG